MAAKEVPQVGQNFWSAAVLGVPQLGQKPNPVAISSASVMVPLDSAPRPTERANSSPGIRRPMRSVRTPGVSPKRPIRARERGRATPS